MVQKMTPKYLWCSGCRETREQEDTGQREMIGGRKHKLFRCNTCKRINKFCG